MLTVKNSILRGLQVTISSAIMIGLAWSLMIPGDGDKLFAWVTFCFFFVTMVTGIYRLADRRAKILIDQQGIYFPGAYCRIIDWEEIASFEASRASYEDIICIQLKKGDFLRLKFFHLNIAADDLQKHARTALNIARGICEDPERRKKIAAMGLADFAKKRVPNDSTQAGATEIFSDSAGGHFESISQAVTAEEGNTQLSHDEESENIGNTENTEKTEQNYLKSPWLFPPWFSDDAVINEVIWVSCLFSGMTAVLFIYSYFDTMGPPKIGVFEQWLAIIGAGPLAALAFYLRNFNKYNSYSSRQPTRKKKEPNRENPGKTRIKKKRR